jgi:hypothetical protein
MVFTLSCSDSSKLSEDVSQKIAPFRLAIQRRAEGSNCLSSTPVIEDFGRDFNLPRLAELYETFPRKIAWNDVLILPTVYCGEVHVKLLSQFVLAHF